MAAGVETGKFLEPAETAAGEREQGGGKEVVRLTEALKKAGFEVLYYSTGGPADEDKTPGVGIKIAPDTETGKQTLQKLLALIKEFNDKDKDMPTMGKLTLNKSEIEGMMILECQAAWTQKIESDKTLKALGLKAFRKELGCFADFLKNKPPAKEKAL